MAYAHSAGERGLRHDVREEHPHRTGRKDALPPGVRVGKFEIVGAERVNL
ncbi:hypothetical protein [Deinococcus aluminii]